MNDNRAIKQRIKDLYDLCGPGKLTIKDIVVEAGLPSYKSVVNGLRLASISGDRMDQLEEAALRLRDRKKKATEPAQASI